MAKPVSFGAPGAAAPAFPSVELAAVTTPAIVVPVAAVATELPLFLCGFRALRRLGVLGIIDLFMNGSCCEGGVLSPLGASFRDRGRLELSEVTSAWLGVVWESAGADSDLLLESDVSGNFWVARGPAALTGSVRPSWLRLKSPTPIVRTAESFLSMLRVLATGAGSALSVVEDDSDAPEIDFGPLDRDLLLPKADVAPLGWRLVKELAAFCAAENTEEKKPAVVGLVIDD